MIHMPLVQKVFAAELADIVGKIDNPLLNSSYGAVNDTARGGLAGFITNLLRFVFVIAGILAFLNFILAGFQYMTAGGDSKNLQKAWDRIWQSLLGLILIVGSFVLAALFGYLLFGDPWFMLRPKVYGPGL